MDSLHKRCLGVNQAIGPEHAVDLTNHSQWVEDMLENSLHYYTIESFVSEWKMMTVANYCDARPKIYVRLYEVDVS
jgi:hypothetical protein